MATTAQVMKYMNISYAALNRLMREHPNPKKAGSKGKWRGKPFPAAAGKDGRGLVFDEKEVRDWCEQNSEFYRRKKPTQSKITLTINTYLEFLSNYQTNGVGKFDKYLNEIPIEKRDQIFFNKAEIAGDQVLLEFDDIEDAIWFKMKYRDVA